VSYVIKGDVEDACIASRSEASSDLLHWHIFFSLVIKRTRSAQTHHEPSIDSRNVKRTNGPRLGSAGGASRAGGPLKRAARAASRRPGARTKKQRRQSFFVAPHPTLLRPRGHSVTLPSRFTVMTQRFEELLAAASRGAGRRRAAPLSARPRGRLPTIERAAPWLARTQRLGGSHINAPAYEPRRSDCR
jgi:hypothetical protein